MSDPVIKAVTVMLAHTLDSIEYASNSMRKTLEEPSLLKQLLESFGTFPEALGYLPNQGFIDNAAPEVLYQVSRPWFKHSWLMTKRYYRCLTTKRRLFFPLHGWSDMLKRSKDQWALGRVSCDN